MAVLNVYNLDGCTGPSGPVRIGSGAKKIREK